jgi:Prokaryotic homologs of the JAB domain
MRPVPENPYLPTTPAEPPTPYRQPSRHLHLPATLPQAVSAAFADAGGARQEAGALLYGVRGTEPGSADTLHALVIPAQVRHRAHYRIPPESIAAASAATRPRGWVTLGQVHTHPGENVEHSWYDDRHAISTRAVSFVLPHYGRHASDWLARVGIHDYQDGWWHQLTTEQATARVSFTDAPLQILNLSSQNARTT